MKSQTNSNQATILTLKKVEYREKLKQIRTKIWNVVQNFVSSH